MFRNFKQIKKGIVIFAFLLLTFLTLVALNTQAQAITQTIGLNLTEWVVDEGNNAIYAVSKDSSVLIFINKDTLQIENQITLSSQPTDVEMSANKLYVALPSANQIAIIDLSTRSLCQTLYLQNQPYRIAIDQPKLFFVNESQWDKIHVYDMSSNQETAINNPNNVNSYTADLAIDPINHIIYAGDTGTSGGKAYGFSTTDYTLVTKTNYDWDYGFPSPHTRKIIVDGNNVFYACRNLEKNNLTMINGTYAYKIWSGEYFLSPIYVKGNYVFFEDAVFDREKYIQITSLPITASLIYMDSQNYIYMFDPQNLSIRKEILNLELNTTMNHGASPNKMVLDENLNDWKYDPATNYIYAVSRENCKLLYIRANDLTVVGEKYIGSLPLEINIYNNQLYIALKGATKIAVTGKTLESPVSYLHIPFGATDIALAGDKLFAANEDNYGVYNLNTGVWFNFGNTWYDYTDVTLSADSIRNLVYRADSSDKITAFSPADYTTIYQTNFSGWSDPSIIISEDGVYFGGERFTFDLSLLGAYKDAGGYYNAKILNVQGSNIFATDGILDRDSYAALAKIPYEYGNITLAAANSSGTFFMYVDGLKQITKYNSIPELTTPQYLTVDSESYDLYPYNTHQTQVNGCFADGRVSNYTNAATYQITDPEIAKVDSYGKVTALKAGTTTLNVAYTGFSKTVLITVKPELDSITISPNNPNLYAGQSLNLIVTAQYSDGSTQDVTNQATFTSTSPNFVSVTANGLIKGLSTGYSIIQVRFNSEYADCLVSVYPPAVNSISFETGNYSVATGLTQSTKIIAHYTDDSTKEITSNITYQVVDQTIASINSSGVISGLKVGTTTMTAVYNGFTANTTITVLPPVLTRIQFASISYSTNVGFHIYLIKVYSYYSDSSYTDITNSCGFQIGNPQIASVNANGVVLGLQTGQTTLIATYSGKTASTTITIDPPVFDHITLDSGYYSILLGSSQFIRVTAHYSDGSSMDVTSSALYQSSDPNIAYVSSTGLITGLKAGSVNLAVTYSGYTINAQINVSVPPIQFTDGFESNNFTVGGWVNSGCTIQSSYKYSGNYAARFINSATLTKSLNTQNYNSGYLSYYRMATNCKSTCHFIVEWYDGSTWHILEDVMGNFGWTYQSLILPSAAVNNPNFKVRFRTSGNRSTNYAFLDEVSISCY